MLKLEYLKDGIYLKPNIKTGLSNTAILYDSKTANVIDDIAAIEAEQVKIKKSPKKTQLTLHKALWAGLVHETYPIKWSESTKWQ